MTASGAMRNESCFWHQAFEVVVVVPPLQALQAIIVL